MIRIILISGLGIVLVGGLGLLSDPLAMGSSPRAEGSMAATPRHAHEHPDEDVDDWEPEYGQMNLAQVREEIEALRRFMNEATMPYYEEQFREENFQVLTEREPDGSYLIPVPEELAAWKYIASTGVAKVTLPREGFEAVYEARSRTAWLSAREDELMAFEGDATSSSVATLR